MSLRRTALARRTELRAKTPLRRTPMPRKARQVATNTRRRRVATGPSTGQRDVVLDRADGCCELCGRRLHDGTSWLADHSFHHRQPRGMGGVRDDDVHAPFQLLLLCGSATTPGGCHAWVESNRTRAYAAGLLVRHGQDPAVTPVELRSWDTADPVPVLLTEDGHYAPPGGPVSNTTAPDVTPAAPSPEPGLRAAVEATLLALELERSVNVALSADKSHTYTRRLCAEQYSGGVAESINQIRAVLAQHSEPTATVPAGVWPEVAAERERQIAKGWTREHDLTHSTRDLVRYAWERLDRPGWAVRETRRKHLVQAAAMLVAAVEALDARSDGDRP